MQRMIIALSLPLLIAACSGNSGQSENTTTDSTGSVSDTTSARAGVAGIPLSLTDARAAAIVQAIESTAAENKANTAAYYTISSDLSGYESGLNATWYFDSLLHVRYCEASWSMEGTGGQYTYFFEGETLLAGTEEKDYTSHTELTWVHRDFKPAYGFSYSDESTSDTTYLDESKYNTIKQSIMQDLDGLIGRLREYQDSAAVNDGDVTIHLENIVNYGNEYTETEDYTISRKLFRQLIRKEN